MTISELMAEITKRWPRSRPIYEDYIRGLADLQGERLERAWHRTLDGWTASKWPRPADIRKRAETGTALAVYGKRETEAERKLREEREMQEWINSVMRSEIGVDAMACGYGRELYVWAERHKDQWPDAGVVRRCQAVEIRFRDQLHSLLMEGRTLTTTSQMRGLATAAALRMANTMDAFENRLAAQYGVVRNDQRHEQDAR